MFKPEKINTVRIFLLNEDLDDVLSLFYKLKIAQFYKEELPNTELGVVDREDLNELNKKLLKQRSAIKILNEFYPTKGKGKKVKHPKPVEKIHELREIYNKKKEEFQGLLDERKRLNILKQLNVKKEQIDDENIVVGFIPKENKKYLKKLSGLKDFRKYETSKRIYFKVNKKFVDFKYKEFYLPKETIENTKVKLKERKEEIIRLKRRLKNLSYSFLPKLEKEEKQIEEKLRIEEVKEKFHCTDNIAVLTAYVPSKKVKKLKGHLEKNFKNRYEIEVEEAKDPPTLLNNPGYTGEFEDLLRLYSFPKYNEFDPTFINALIFPLFFGFILGDFVYGLISLLVFTLIKGKLENFKGFISILQVSAVSSMIWGLIYGEFIGFELYELLPRAYEPELMLIIALVIGVMHLNLGYLIGFFTHLHKPKEAINEYLSWVIMQIGVAGIALGYIYQIQELLIAGIIVGIISVYMVFKGEGVLGLIHIPSLFTNILSYARLMAVGTSSVVIAMLVNEYSEVLLSQNLVLAVFGVLLFLGGHIFNIILGNWKSFLHPLRLHYVEFLTKFYEGGGEEFQPFGKKNNK